LECKHKRPGLKALQEAIDEFIVAHEEQQEKEKRERPVQQKMDGQLFITRGGKRPQMLKLE